MYVHVEPRMKHLHELVIPKIYTQWEKVTAFLSESLYIMEIIKKDRTSEYPMQCCEDMLRDWLCTEDSLHPCSWKTLIDKLKEIQQLSASAIEIKCDVEQLIRCIAT